MMKLKDRLQAWARVGDMLYEFLQPDADYTPWQTDLNHEISNAFKHNGWFEREQVLSSLRAWAAELSLENLQAWVDRYPDANFEPAQPKRVGLVMAGNIPLVGLHDLLCVSICGHDAVVKMSSDDDRLMPVIIKALGELGKRVEWVSRLANFDAIIATGSNNTARYFHFYFNKYPHIIRNNRKSVAVLTEDEVYEEIYSLGDDVFRYFGLGCRNVSKLFLPDDYDLDRIFGAWIPFHDVAQNHKYASNYDYHRALYLLDKVSFIENGFVIVKSGTSMATPVSVLHVQRYVDIAAVRKQLNEERDQIQCIVTNQNWEELPVVPFGASQSPALWHYADNVDTIAFLTGKGS